MFSINAAVIDLKQLELFANNYSTIHSLDARSKVLVTLFFIIAVVSYNKYEIAGLLPFFIFPVTISSLSRLPAAYLINKIAFISPFILLVGVFNPVFDTTYLYKIGHFNISGGWLSLLSLLIRSILTVSAAFILIATTGFTAICKALENLGIPKVFTVQLLFLYRYIFILADETARITHAQELRACGKKGLGIRSFGSLTGHLLLRTWERAERIHCAMQARGFVGQLQTSSPMTADKRDFIFVSACLSLFIAFRFFNIATIPEAFLTGLFQ